MNALDVDHLTVRYSNAPVLDDVSLHVAVGEIVALVGPSGSGKSTLAAATLGLLPPGTVVDGEVRIGGVDLAGFGERQLRRVRGIGVGMIFQEPATALNPALTIGRQIGEVVRLHRGLRGTALRQEVARLMGRVGLAVATDRHPHSLSGGQRQRVAIAMAIAAGPSLLLADEPTAALDPAARAEIARLLVSLAREDGMGLLVVTHDLALAAGIADRTVALDHGRIAPPAASAADPSRRPHRRQGAPALVLEGVARRYPGASLPALSGVALTLHRGETLAVVGASGSGKSTLARIVLGLDRPDAGTVLFDGAAWNGRGAALRDMRRKAQAVFQDPATSFDPRRRVGSIVAEPLHLLGPMSGEERRRRVADALADVGLPADAADRLPQSFSGGQRQRIALARAIVLEPRLIVLDEALSALDPALREEMALLLERLQAEHGTAYLFIAHDMEMVQRLADRVLVLDEGRVVASGAVETVLG